VPRVTSTVLLRSSLSVGGCGGGLIISGSAEVDCPGLSLACPPVPDPATGDYLLPDLTSVHVQTAFTAIVWCRAAAGHRLARGTLKRIHATLRAALNFAVCPA
jgi:hypothetical protein